ncbi:Maf family protein [Nisaea sp.]|uniref:Maf family protein n=1 Tax=Nisaea sp. TaxID=2024842 RepID=UPI003B518A08
MTGPLRLRAPSGAHFVLASASPRRLDLLGRIGLKPDLVSPADIDETPKKGELPSAYAERVAWEKAHTVALAHPEAWVLAADTVVASGRRILPKAESETEARACLKHLSGRRHRVIGAIRLIGPGDHTRSRISETVVTFKRLTREEIETYIAAGEWDGKAGGYAIQGLAAIFIRFLSGSHSNVVGLDLYETRALLAGCGFRYGEGDA